MRTVLNFRRYYFKCKKRSLININTETRELLKEMRTPATPTIEAIILKMIDNKEKDNLVIEHLLEKIEKLQKQEQ